MGDNPIQTPPLEVVKQGRQAMLDWYAANKKELKEIKVILIGDPKAGKTSLLKRLKNDDFDENEVQTDGINIEDVAFETCGTFDEQKELHGLTAHFWDFGGQEIMNATHQFFLTNRSVYIIVLDARKDTKSGEQVSNWVRRIKATSGKSPILVVANQIDVNTSFGFENVTELRKEFPEIKGFIKASCKEEGHEGITAIKHQLAGLIPQAELFNTEIDERWVEIKEQLQKETRANQYLNDKRFRTICKKFELPEKEKQVNAIQFLHDLGIVLHFNEVKAYKYYVLDPMWITYGVYQILTSAKAGVAKGLVDVEDLDYIVNEEEDKKDSYRPKEFIEYHYDHSERLFLVDVLHQFKLCFYQPDRQKFILPDLLDTAEPTETTDAIRSEDGNIHFVYDYDYLPKSTMPRIMVENHTNLVAMWRTGCVLQKGQCHAIVSSYQNQLSLLVSGSSPEKREFMSILRHKIDQINSGLTQKPDMLIPLPGTEEFADYEELLEREKDGEKTYKLYKPIKKEFTISELLEGIAREDEMRRDMQKILMYQRQQRKGQQLISDQLDRIEETGKATLSEVQATNLRLEEAIKHLLALPDLAELEAMTRRLWEDNHQLLEAKSTEELQNVSTDLMRFIKTGFEQHQEQFDTQLTAIYQDLSKSDNTALKVKVGIPLIGLLGINVEGEWDVKNWAKEMEEKYRWEIFKGLQKLGYFR
ncbi:MAG: COR domain-containing protein [Bacteroidota bacterium]